MAIEKKREKSLEFVIICDREPVKLMVLTPAAMRRFCNRLSRRYPEHRWSVSHRFAAQGAD